MEQALKEQVELLLAEAEQAVDDSANGLMDRSDFRHLIEKLAGVTRMLSERCEELEQDRQGMSRRLSRSSTFELTAPLMLHG